MGGIFSSQYFHTQLKPVIYSKDKNELTDNNIDVLFYNASSKEIIPIEKSQADLFYTEKYSPFLFSKAYLTPSDSFYTSRYISLYYLDYSVFSLDKENILYSQEKVNEVFPNGKVQSAYFDLQSQFLYKAFDLMKIQSYEDYFEYMLGKSLSSGVGAITLETSDYIFDTTNMVDTLKNHKGFFFKPKYDELSSIIGTDVLSQLELLLAGNYVTYDDIIFYFDPSPLNYSAQGSYENNYAFDTTEERIELGVAHLLNISDTKLLLTLADFGYPNITIYKLTIAAKLANDYIKYSINGGEYNSLTYDKIRQLYAPYAIIEYNEMNFPGMLYYYCEAEVTKKYGQNSENREESLSDPTLYFYINFSIGSNLYYKNIANKLFYNAGSLEAWHGASKNIMAWLIGDFLLELVSNSDYAPNVRYYTSLKDGVTNFGTKFFAYYNKKYIMTGADETSPIKMCLNIASNTIDLTETQTQLEAEGHTNFTELPYTDLDKLQVFNGTLITQNGLDIAKYWQQGLKVDQAKLVPTNGINQIANPFIAWDDTVNNNLVTADNYLEYCNPKKGYLDTQYNAMIYDNLIGVEDLFNKLDVRKATTADIKNVNILLKKEYCAKDIAESYNIYVIDEIVFDAIYNTDAIELFEPNCILLVNSTMVMYQYIKNTKEWYDFPLVHQFERFLKSDGTEYDYNSVMDDGSLIEKENLTPCFTSAQILYAAKRMYFKRDKNLYHIKTNQNINKNIQEKSRYDYGWGGNVYSSTVADWAEYEAAVADNNAVFNENFTGERKVLPHENFWLENYGLFRRKIFLTDLKIKAL